jgi:hypothetical protein
MAEEGDWIFNGLGSLDLGSILFDLYGFSWRLIAGFWDSLSNYLTYRAIKPRTTNHEDKTLEVRKFELINLCATA